MANVKSEYGTDAQAITITLASLASAAARESATIDNLVNKFLEALVEVKVQTNASAPTGDKACYVYVWGTVDYTATATFPDRVTGADAAITPDSPTNLKLLGKIECPAASTSYKMQPSSVAALFQGTLPAKWGIVVVNATGNALDTVAGNFEAQYQGAFASSV